MPSKLFCRKEVNVESCAKLLAGPFTVCHEPKDKGYANGAGNTENLVVGISVTQFIRPVHSFNGTDVICICMMQHSRLL